MENHIVKFVGNLRIQNDGAPIEDEVTGALADLFILFWDRKTLGRLQELDIYVSSNPPKAIMKFDKSELELKSFS